MAGGRPIWPLIREQVLTHFGLELTIEEAVDALDTTFKLLQAARFLHQLGAIDIGYKPRTFELAENVVFHLRLFIKPLLARDGGQPEEPEFLTCACGELLRYVRIKGRDWRADRAILCPRCRRYLVPVELAEDEEYQVLTLVDKTLVGLLTQRQPKQTTLASDGGELDPAKLDALLDCLAEARCALDADDPDPYYALTLIDIALKYDMSADVRAEVEEARKALLNGDWGKAKERLTLVVKTLLGAREPARGRGPGRTRWTRSSGRGWFHRELLPSVRDEPL